MFFSLGFVYSIGVILLFVFFRQVLFRQALMIWFWKLFDHICSFITVFRISCNILHNFSIICPTICFVFLRFNGIIFDLSLLLLFSICLASLYIGNAFVFLSIEWCPQLGILLPLCKVVFRRVCIWFRRCILLWNCGVFWLTCSIYFGILSIWFLSVRTYFPFSHIMGSCIDLCFLVICMYKWSKGVSNSLCFLHFITIITIFFIFIYFCMWKCLYVSIDLCLFLWIFWFISVFFVGREVKYVEWRPKRGNFVNEGALWWVCTLMSSSV